MKDKFFSALKSSVFQIANLHRIKISPTLTVKLVVKFLNEARIPEINERITDVALILEIDGQIEEVVVVHVILVDFLKQKLLRVFVRNIPDHNGGPGILSGLQGIDRIQL